MQRNQHADSKTGRAGSANLVVSSGGTSYFNDMLGTTLGAKAKGKYSAAALSAFGEPYHMTGEAFFGQGITAIQRVKLE